MIELRDKDKNRVAGLVDYENLCIESILESGDKTLSFYYPKKGKYYDEIVEEAYIRTKKDEFVVKARELDDEYTKFECSLNLEELEGNIFDRFESVEQTITSALNLAVVGTGWTVKDNTLKKRRTVRCTNKSSLEIVREIKKVYRVDIVFNTLGKQIEVYEHLGEDKGTYFIDSLNLIALQVQSDSRQYATRIIAEGKDGLSFSDINNGKNYVENYQYSNKVKTIYWKDERYTIKENLLEDARAKLEELSKPFRSYSASILNLAELNPRYSSILDFKLGDAINLISKKNKIKDKQRIVKTIEWPQDHTKDSVELANATLKFEDIQQENQETTDTVNNITTDNGTVDGSTIDSITTKQIEDFEANVIKVAKLKAILAEIENLHVNKADIQNLNAVIARIGTLEATKASITELNAIHAIIQQIKAGKADIADLNAAVAKVGILENKTAVLENALAGNLTADNFKTNAITAGSAVIAEGAIGSSQISSLSVNKLEAGDITTSKHRIVSADGTIEIVGNQILITRNNVNRVILGEYRKSDGTTEYGLLVRAKDGQTIMLDGNGVHNAGITDGAIDNNKVADNANISGNKLDINSVIREVNTHGTETIKGTKVQIGDRTLDVELSTQKNAITEHSKELSSQKASLTALDNALKFKVDSQTFTQSTETINSNINRAKEQAIIGARSIPDTRNDNQSPGWYMQHYAFQTITEFKYSNVIGIPNGGSWFGTLETTVPWNNSSGGYPTQVFRSNSSPVYQRHGTDLNTWSSWEQIEDTQGSQAKANSALSNAKSYSDSKKQEAIKAAENLALEKSNLAKKYAEDVATAKANLAKTEAIANADGKISAEEKKRIQQAQENLNTAISKADKAKQDAISEANRVAELKKQEAINSANNHADSKANEALNNAKAFVNAEITTVNSHLNKATAEINVLKKQIELKVGQSDVDKSIQNIKFNDVNMILNSGEFKDKNHWSITNGDENLLVQDNNLIAKFKNYAKWGLYVSNNSLRNKPLDVNKDYTVVCKLKSSVETSVNFQIIDGDGGNHVYSKELNLNNEWKLFKFTFKPYQVGNQRQFRFISSERDYNFDLYINFVKMVEGTTSSDSWSMAPDYVLDNIKTVTDKISTVESKFTQENNSIKASVQDLNSTTQSITTNVSNINRDLTSKINSNLDAAKSFATDIAIAKANLAKTEAIANADGKISAEEKKRIQQAQENLNTAISKVDKAKQDAINTASSDATNKANNALNSAKAFINAEITTVNNKVHNVESNLNILSNEIKSKVSQSDIDKSISEIKLGGRNLLSNTYKFKNLNNWSLAKGPNQNGTLELIEDSIYGNVLHTTKPNSVSWWVLGNYPIRLPEGKFTVGKEYTISFYAKAKEPVSIDISFIDANGLNSVSSILRFNLTTEWKYYYGTIRAKATGNTPELYITSNIGEHWWTMFKLEEGNKPSDWSPAPEDTTSLVEDSIRVIDTKISDVSSSVTQLRDSVTTQINSINSKTHSIETTLGGKASKQEVTEVNNRVATIKASLDGITQRVSATESKTQTLETTINGKASKQEVNNVSSKVVSLEANLNGITNRVSSTESRINTLNGQVANATTKQEFTEFKQSTNKFIMDIQQSGNENLCTNGGFESNDTNIVKWKSNQCNNAYVSGKVNEIIPQDGGNFFFIDTNGGDAYAMTTLSFMFEEGQTYTISVDCRYASVGGKITGSSFVEYWGNYSRIWESQDFGYNWHRVSSTWTAPSGHGAGRAFIRFGIRCDKYAWGAFDNVKVEKGTMATGYTSPGNSICGNTITADYEKLRCQFKSGAYNQMGEKGNMWYAPGMEYPYRALSWNEAVSINTDGSNNYIYRDVQLPARFDYVDPQYIEITASLKGWYKYTGKVFNLENITVSTGKVYRANGHTYAQIACRGCIRHADTFGVEGLQVVATLHVTA
ncbi:phage tail spike protein [Clostridium perfringens]